MGELIAVLFNPGEVCPAAEGVLCPDPSNFNQQWRKHDFTGI